VIDIATRRAPVTEPAAPAVGAASPAVDLAQVREAWNSVVEVTRARSISKASQLLSAEPLAIDGTTVVLGFANDFARSFWQDRERPELERDLSSALGTAVRVKCVKQTTPETAPPATEDPMLRAALETFRRPERILEVE